MSSYYIIFINSFFSCLLLSLRSESAWFAALKFGNYNMPLATLMACAGAVLGTSADFIAGYFISAMCARWFHSDRPLFMRASGYFRRYGMPLLLFPWLPFLSLMALIAGIFRVPPLIFMGIMISGRIIYYSYYLLQS